MKYTNLFVWIKEREEFKLKKLLFIALCLSVSVCFAEEIDVFKLAEGGTPAQLKDALKKGAKFNVQHSIHDFDDYPQEDIDDWLFDTGETPLHRAAAYNHNPGSIKFLIEQGLDVNALASVGNISLETPLICAVWHKNISAVKELFKHGADPNVWDEGGYSFAGTPLHIVAFNYNGKNDIPIAREMITELVKAGGNVNNHEEVSLEELKEIIKYEPELAEDKTIFTLKDRLTNGEPYFEIKLFSHATNGVFLETLTPLMWAVFCDNPDMVDIFLDFNADVNLRSVENKTAVDYANNLPANSKIRKSLVFKRLQSVAYSLDK